jgi:hypothetical protein
VKLNSIKFVENGQRDDDEARDLDRDDDEGMELDSNDFSHYSAKYGGPSNQFSKN